LIVFAPHYGCSFPDIPDHDDNALWQIDGSRHLQARAALRHVPNEAHDRFLSAAGIKLQQAIGDALTQFSAPFFPLRWMWNVHATFLATRSYGDLNAVGPR
jgi:hypothetical protein